MIETQSILSTGVRKNFHAMALLLLSLLLFSCKTNEVIPRGLPATGPPESITLNDAFFYRLNLNDRNGDTFKVGLYVNGLTADNNIFQFPATVPGTYGTLNMGRFVSNFRVLDDEGNELSSAKISTNQWEIIDPENAYYIEYEMDDIWDSPGNRIFRMAATSLENDHALLNTFGILGFPTGLKKRDFFLDVDYPDSWTAGTSLETTSDGLYWAKDYDFLVDSPILMGNLTSAGVTVDDTQVNVFTYSENGQITSSAILNDIEQVINDARAFLKVLPVDRYNFLFHFDSQRSAGALEHSFSSVYALQELTYTSEYGDFLRSISAHEFFHIVTPLNIHSEIISDFNFAVPTPSEHLWLYEGVTEWASDMMQYRNGSMNLETLLAQYQTKISRNETYDATFSLSEISLKSYTLSGNAQFGNIYNRGALIAALLDIRLLQLSGGSFGLREFILELVETYGPDHSFPETEFFDVVVDQTYPEIDAFIQSYIRGEAPLPIIEYFDLLGISYNPALNTFENQASKTTSQQALFDAWSINLD